MSDDGNTYTEIKANGQSVYYFDYGNRTAMLRKGNVPWRATNPTNLTGTTAGTTIGTITTNVGVTRHFGVYPDEESGYRTAANKLAGSGYSGLTLDKALNKWVTGSTSKEPRAGYKSSVAAETGYSLNTVVGQLPDLDVLVRAMARQEGYFASGNSKEYLKLFRIVACHTDKPHKQGKIVRVDLNDGSSLPIKQAIKLAENYQLPGIVVVHGATIYLQCRDDDKCTDLDSLKVDDN